MAFVLGGIAPIWIGMLAGALCPILRYRALKVNGRVRHLTHLAGIAGVLLRIARFCRVDTRS